MVLNDLKNFKAVYTSGDGNCLYNSIAIQLYNSEKKFYLIKLGVLNTLFNHENAFRILLSRTGCKNDLDTFIESIATQNAWGDQYCEIAISLLCNRRLNCYCIDPEALIPYSYEYCMVEENVNRRPLLITFQTNHFSAILACKIDDIATTPRANHYKKQFHMFFKND
jgi:hypothetical protein